MIRFLLLFSVCAVSVAAQAQSPRFENIAGFELQQMLRADGVALSAGGSAYYPTFYSESFNRLEEVRCEQIATFGLIAKANESGNVLVAACEKEAPRVRALARDAQRGLAAVLDELRRGGMNIDEAVLKAGWSYRRIDAPDGEEHHFPVLMIGHGILGPQTLVFAPRGDRRVIVIQSDLRRHCENYSLGATAPCADTNRAFAQLARRVIARLPR